MQQRREQPNYSVSALKSLGTRAQAAFVQLRELSLSSFFCPDAHQRRIDGSGLRMLRLDRGRVPRHGKEDARCNDDARADARENRLLLAPRVRVRRTGGDEPDAAAEFPRSVPNTIRGLLALGVLIKAIENLSEVEGRRCVGEAEQHPVEDEECVERDPCRAVHPDEELRVPRRGMVNSVSAEDNAGQSAQENQRDTGEGNPSERSERVPYVAEQSRGEDESHRYHREELPNLELVVPLRSSKQRENALHTRLNHCRWRNADDGREKHTVHQNAGEALRLRSNTCSRGRRRIRKADLRRDGWHRG